MYSFDLWPGSAGFIIFVRLYPGYQRCLKCRFCNISRLEFSVALCSFYLNYVLLEYCIAGSFIFLMHLDPSLCFNQIPFSAGFCYLRYYTCVRISCYPRSRVNCQCHGVHPCTSAVQWRTALCLSVCLYVCACVSVCLCLSLSVSVCLCLSLSVCLCLSVSVCLSICLSVCLSLSVCVHVSVLSVWLEFCSLGNLIYECGYTKMF